MPEPRQRRGAVVIGSGPAGAACAWALAERGFKPVVVDVGRRLEADKESALQRATEGGRLDARFVNRLENAFPVDVDRLPLKPVFGSLFPYADAEPALATRASRVGVVQSVGYGGLSNVWGAAVLPFEDADLVDWPVAVRDLDPFYRSTFRFVPLAGVHDDLADRFPLYSEPQPLDPTPQIAAIAAHLKSRRTELRVAGVVTGRSRLAVAAGSSALAAPCTYSGLCMHGCPFGSIYNAAKTVDELVRAGRAEYLRGSVVERLEEAGGGVRVIMRTADGAPSESLMADRVFVAAGVLGSTRIILASLEAYDRRVPLLESAYYTVPLLLSRRHGRVGRGRAGNTLSQLFLEVSDPKVSAHGVHLQVYGYSDLMLRAVAARLHAPERVATGLLQPLLGRLLFSGGYLHSAESPRMSAELTRERGDDVLVVVAGEGTPEQRVRRLMQKLRSLRSLTGFTPLTPMLQIWPQGKGFHVGGSFPMRTGPGEFESDVLGRPRGFDRVHVVDASVFPSIPATTITLTSMANAQRIVAQFHS